MPPFLARQLPHGNPLMLGLLKQILNRRARDLTGGWGLSIQTEGLAKFGQLYLQKGKWNGKEIIPAAWVKAEGCFWQCRSHAC